MKDIIEELKAEPPMISLVNIQPKYHPIPKTILYPIENKYRMLYQNTNHSYAVIIILL